MVSVRKIVGLCFILAGLAISFVRVLTLPKPDFWIGLFILVAVSVPLFLPAAIFGASIEPRETSVRVTQYRSVELDYSEIRSCHRYVFPPFEGRLSSRSDHFRSAFCS
jgi:hypothetical protein